MSEPSLLFRPVTVLLKCVLAYFFLAGLLGSLSVVVLNQRIPFDALARFMQLSGVLLVGQLTYYVWLFLSLWRDVRDDPRYLAGSYKIPKGEVLAPYIPSWLVFVFLLSISNYFHIRLAYQTSMDTALAGTAPWQGALVLFIFGLVGPLVEEYYFRGVLLQWLNVKFGCRIAPIANGLVFSLVHLRFIGRPAVASSLVLLVLGYWASRNTLQSRSLWPAALLHSTYNTLILLPPLIRLL